MSTRVREVGLRVDDPGLRAMLLESLRAAGYRATALASGEEDASSHRVVILQVEGPDDIGLLERFQSASPRSRIVAIGATPDPALAVRARQGGARAFLRMPFTVGELDRVLLECEPGPGLRSTPEILTRDPAMLDLLDQIERAAATDATIRLHGESGTGKDLIAAAIHRASPRRAGPFVAVGCGGLDTGLAESELFGHVAGAFTGATGPRIGRVSAASGGTLVLDDVSELDPFLQPKLLRVLQEREITPLGSRESEEVDLRVIANHQRDLSEEVARGRFREDLFFRLDVIAFRVPPLRERPCDIPLLAEALVARFARELGSEAPVLSDDAIARLQRYAFPGNVRELENLARRAAVLFPGREVELDALLSQGARRAAPAPAPETFDLRELERRTILRALDACDGNRTQAARALGISVRTLRNKLRGYSQQDPSAASPAASSPALSA